MQRLKHFTLIILVPLVGLLVLLMWSPTTGRVTYADEGMRDKPCNNLLLPTNDRDDAGESGDRGPCKPPKTPRPPHTPRPTRPPTDTATPTSLPTDTPTNTATPTNLPTDTPTNTPSPTFTPTDTPTNTATPTNLPTDTPTNTATPTNLPTDTPTNTPSPTFTPTSTATPVPQANITVYNTGSFFVHYYVSYNLPGLPVQSLYSGVFSVNQGITLTIPGTATNVGVLIQFYTGITGWQTACTRSYAKATEAVIIVSGTTFTASCTGG